MESDSILQFLVQGLLSLLVDVTLNCIFAYQLEKEKVLRYHKFLAILNSGELCLLQP